MRRESVGMVPVVGPDDRVIGVVTDRDIVVRGCASPRPLAEQTAEDVMTTDVECVRSDEPLSRVITKMAERRIWRVPVIDAAHKRGHKVVGVLSLDDVASRASEEPELLEALHKIADKRRLESEARRSGVQAPREAFLPALWRRLRG